MNYSRPLSTGLILLTLSATAFAQIHIPDLLALSSAASTQIRMPDPKQLKRGDDFKAGLYITALNLHQQLQDQGLIEPNRAPPLCLSADLQSESHKLEIVMKTDGNYAPGKASLTPQAEAQFTRTATTALNSMHRFLKECGKTKSFRTRLTGYADGIPPRASGKNSYNSNLELAQNRANTLADLMRPQLNGEISATLKTEGFVDPRLIEKKQACVAHRAVTLEIESNLEGLWKIVDGKLQIEPEIEVAKDVNQNAYQSAATLSALQLIRRNQPLPIECQSNPQVKEALKQLTQNWAEFERHGLTEKNDVRTLEAYLAIQSEPSVNSSISPLPPSTAFCFDVESAWIRLWKQNSLQAIDLTARNSIQIDDSKIENHGKHNHRGYYCSICGSGARYSSKSQSFVIEPRWMSAEDPNSATPQVFGAYATVQYILKNPMAGSLESTVDEIIKFSRKINSSYYFLNSHGAENLRKHVYDTLYRLNRSDDRDDEEPGDLRAREWAKISARVKQMQFDSKTQKLLNAFNNGERWKTDLNALASSAMPTSRYAELMKPVGFIVSGKCNSITEQNLAAKLQSSRKIEITPQTTEAISETTECLIIPPVAGACPASPQGNTSGGLNESLSEIIACASAPNPLILEIGDAPERDRIVDSMICSESTSIQRPTRNSEVDCKKRGTTAKSVNSSEDHFSCANPWE